MKDYVAFDLETTGLSPDSDQIIEIGAVKIRDGKISGKYNCIIHPEIEVSDFIINLTGISRDMLRKGIPLKEGVEEFLEFSGDLPVLGHNVMFDYKFMKMAAASFKYPFEKTGVDTLKVARKLLTGLENKKLETLCAHYHYVNQAAHRAYDDALATAVVFEQMKKEFPTEEEIFQPQQLQFKVKKERPATPKQKKYLENLMKYHAIGECLDIDQMTQREASKKIDHIILNYDVYTIKGLQTIQAEIQIRTMAMDFWATIEHSLQYKYRHNMPEHIREKLLNAANATVALDQEMSSVRGEIMDAQNSFNYKASIVADILTNIQNLYYVGNQREVVKIQNEFYDIYQKDDLEKLEDFSKQLDIIAEGYKAQGL